MHIYVGLFSYIYDIYTIVCVYTYTSIYSYVYACMCTSVYIHVMSTLGGHSGDVDYD